jgi:hypothetical protein
MEIITEFIDQKLINKNRKFKRGKSPYTALKSFLKNNNKFLIDNTYQNNYFACRVLNSL